MPTDDLRGLPGAMLAPMTRMGEAIARLDGRVNAEIAALKKDTEMIRGAQHDQAATMQQFVAAERDCARGLATLTEKVIQLADQLGRLSLAVEANATARTKAEGAWWALTKAALILCAVGSGIVVAVSAAGWIWTQLLHVPTR